MRRAWPLLIVAGVLAACAGASSRARTATTAPTVSPAVSTTALVVATAATANPPTPLPTSEQDVVTEQTVRSCITPALPAEAPAAAGQFDTCLNRGEGGFRVLAVEGDMPVVLVETRGQPGDCRSYDVIVWRTDGGWQAQSASPLLPDPINEALLGAAWAVGPAAPAPYARMDAKAGPLLAVLVGTAVCGSGPGTVPMLFALRDGQWQRTWDPAGSELAALTGPQSDFADASGIDRVRVRSAIWGTTGDVFYEADAGPHRYADELWTRDGDGYALTSSTIEPSAYNTLVNFVYRLSAGDDAGATKLLADASLLDTAKGLGLVQQPLGQQWLTDLDATTQCCGPIRIAGSAAQQPGPPQAVVVTFEQRGGDWLIAGIAAE